MSDDHPIRGSRSTRVVSSPYEDSSAGPYLDHGVDSSAGLRAAHVLFTECHNSRVCLFKSVMD